MRPGWIKVARIAGTTLAVIVAIVLILSVYVNTRSGFGRVAWLTEQLTNGHVGITELSGRFPNALRADRVEIRDDTGPWLVLENVVMDWSAWALISNHIDISRLEARRVQILRLPEDKDDKPDDSPLRIDIAGLNVPTLETAPEFSRIAMVFRAQGGLHYVSLQDVGADLALLRRDGTDSYRVNAAIKDGVANGTVRIDEKPAGLIAGILDLNDIGAITFDARADVTQGVNNIGVRLDAGQLHAAADGTLDLATRRTNFEFSVTAPAMNLRPDLSWNAIAAEGRAEGTFAQLAIDSKLNIDDFRLGENRIGRLAADLVGTNGSLDFKGTATALQLADADPNLFTRNPIELTGHADLGEDALPVRFVLSHPVLSLDGDLTLHDHVKGKIAGKIPRLELLESLTNLDIVGSGTFNSEIEETDAGLHLIADGVVVATDQTDFLAKLLGRNARLNVVADIDGGDVDIEQAHIDGAAAEAQVSGQIRDRVLTLDSTITFANLALISETMRGDVRVTATARGPMQTARLDVSAVGNVGTASFRPQRLTLKANGTGLPKPSTGAFQIIGNFAEAPVAMKGGFGWKDDVVDLSDMTATWKSLSAAADMAYSDTAGLRGMANLQLGNMQDLAAFTGRHIEGKAEASVDFEQRNGASHGQVNAVLSALNFDGTKIGNLQVAGDVEDPTAKQVLALNLVATGIDAQGYTGDATGRIRGPVEALIVNVDAKLADEEGRPATVVGEANFDADFNSVKVASLNGTYREQRITLREPVNIDYANGVVVQNLAATIGEARLDVNGRLTPRLEARASLQNVTARMLAPFAQLSQGTVSATAELTGTLDAPLGNVTVEGRNLRYAGVSTGVMPGSLDARAILRGRDVSVDASMTAGPSTMTVKGEAPLTEGGMMALHAEGAADLAILNPILSAEGRTLRGQLMFNADIAGTRANPNVTGTGRLTGGEFRDQIRGIRATEIALNTEFQGNIVRITNITGRAGPGTISGSGTINLAEKGIPIDMVIEARNARPIETDRLRATVDANLTLKGELRGRRAVAGTINIRNGETVIPDNYPPEVVVLRVRRAGEEMTPEMMAPSTEILDLDLTIRSNGQFFVRGRGLDAELEGELRLRGTETAPIVTGGLNMKRGMLDLAGRSILLTSGRVAFDGVGLRNRLDPTLAFVAQTTSGGVTAKLEVTGYVSAPRVMLSSTPPLPQDEILARLLFQQSIKELSPFQLAEIAQVAASLGGLGSGFNPLASVRRGLGLDRLTLESVEDPQGAGTTTTIEAGKYVMRNVYVGAKRGVANTTQAEVEVDITRGLKARATIALGANAAVTQGSTQQQDLGSSVGLSYEFEY